MTAPDLSPIAGNLDSWPDAEITPAESGAEDGGGGWVAFTFGRPIGDDMRTHHARARVFQLVGGFRLLVGHDVQEQVEWERRLRKSLIGAVVATLLLATSDEASRAWEGPPWALAPSELATYAMAGLERVGLDHPSGQQDEPAMEVRLVLTRPDDQGLQT